MELSLRVTSDSATHDDIIKIIDEVTDKYIISLEYANSRHFQCYINYIGKDDLKYSNLRYLFKKAGFKGNKDLSITKMRSKNLQIYVLKEGDYVYKGFTSGEIAELASQAYEKPMSYKDKKKEVSLLYLSGKINEEQCVRKLIQLLCEFEMEYHRHKVVGYVKMLLMKKSEKHLEAEIFQILLSV